MAELNFEGAAAVKVTVVFSGGALTAQFKRTKARCLPSLPTMHATRPLIGLDLIGLGDVTLYRRHYTPPGQVEVPGIRPRWVLLRRTHPQVLVVLVPHLPDTKRIDFYSGDSVWMSHAVPGDL